MRLWCGTEGGDGDGAITVRTVKGRRVRAITRRNGGRMGDHTITVRNGRAVVGCAIMVRNEVAPGMGLD